MPRLPSAARPSRWTAVAGLCAALGLGGAACANGDGGNDDGRRAVTTAPPAALALRDSGWVRAHRTPPKGSGWELLDVAANGAALWGRRDPAPPRADPRTGYQVRLVPRGSPGRPLVQNGGPLLDARFVPGTPQRVAVVSTAGHLEILTPATGARTRLDTGVLPGLGVDPRGGRLAYAAGVAPEVDLYLVDVAGRRRRRLTRTPGPKWAPTFAPGGGRLLFAASTAGYPALWTVDTRGGKPRQLTARGTAVPDGRRPAVWTQSAIAVPHARGVTILHPDGRLRRFVAKARHVHASGGALGRDIVLLTPHGWQRARTTPARTRP